MCVRKWLDVKQHCPACKKAAQVSDLVPNRAIDALIEEYKILKTKHTFENSMIKSPRKTRGGESEGIMVEEGAAAEEEDDEQSSQRSSIRPPEGTAECPICHTFVSLSFINTHVNSCVTKPR